eukprot:767274-Hanusia_phi.AAC.4
MSLPCRIAALDPTNLLGPLPSQFIDNPLDAGAFGVSVKYPKRLINDGCVPCFSHFLHAVVSQGRGNAGGGGSGRRRGWRGEVRKQVLVLTRSEFLLRMILGSQKGNQELSKPGFRRMGCLQGKEEAASKPKNPEPPKQEAVKPAPVSQMKPETKAETKATPRQITMKEVTEHTKDPDIWFVIHGKVYSVGDFKDHPGGFQVGWRVRAEEETHSPGVNRPFKDRQAKTSAANLKPCTMILRRSSLKVTVKKFGFICGGSGITPAFQAILDNPEDNTTSWLISANQKEEDILLRSELDRSGRLNEINLLNCSRWAEEHSNRFKCYYTLSRETPEGKSNRRGLKRLVTSPPGWKFGSGYVNESMISEHMPAAGWSMRMSSKVVCMCVECISSIVLLLFELTCTSLYAGPDTIICLCGPLVMIDDTCIPLLKKAGFSDEQIFVF